MTWDTKFMGLAYHIGGWSKDPSNKVCAIAVADRTIRSTGYNGFPKGIMDTPDRLNNRDLKYPLMVHAEINNICNAARVGAALEGCTMYISGLPPCEHCANAMIQAGIIRVCTAVGLDDVPERWQKSCNQGYANLREAGVQFVHIPFNPVVVTELPNPLVKPAVREVPSKIVDLLVDQLGIDKARVNWNTHFRDDLGCDSLDEMDLVMACEEEFGVDLPDEIMDVIDTVGEAVEAIEKIMQQEGKHI